MKQMNNGITPPRRAFCLTLKMEADNRKALVSALMNFAVNIDREEITEGAIGGYDSGASYELLIDHTQTHEGYCNQLNEYLRNKLEYAND